ncbi:RNA-directed DNA polymerase from mobile element jockey [Elysia marginata]|uniref:RNA-directed DNA polymerase from mobile element jockey n=1 Tax=Elysia marginata TaxID=1093978 RepID=A0AAV4EJ63_9GAST|nr:RNA-directed DNA polymerase from mobile element jockey [Elysia marginata]
MDTDLGSTLSADPGGCPLSPLVLIKAKWPPSPGPAKAAGALKKEDTSETVFRQEFAQLREKYTAYKEAFTDGSKSEKVAAASFYPKDPDKPDKTRLNDDSTIFNAELEGISLALKYFQRKRILRSVMYTDSLSAIQALQGKIFKNKNVARIYNLLAKLAPRTKVVLVWIPSHVGIPGNEKVDGRVKPALNQEIHDDKQVIWSDLKLKVNTHLEQLWQTDWILKSTINFKKLDQILKKDSIMMKD